MKRILLVGATGLVGQAVLRHVAEEPQVGKLVALTRRPLGSLRPGWENPLVDFDALPAEADWWSVDGVICTLGTTIRKAGSQAAFRRVDFDYPLAIATRARQAGASAFALTSSLGADARSRTFYLRTKGELEDALRTCGFPSLTIVRPSFIGGERSERRPLERLGLGLFRFLGPLLPRRYRIVSADRIARRLLAAALTANPGTRVVESEEI